MLYFHQVQFLTSQLFWCTPHLWLIPDSTPHMFESFVIIQVAFIFSLIFYCSLFFPSTLFRLSFDHFLFYSLIILVPCVPFHHSCLCMWISFACDFICALLHPPLPFPYPSLWYFLYLILLLSPSLWLLCMCPTPYIISYSPVLVL